jgi:hypothetical protein
MSRRGVDIGASTAGVEVTLIDFTLSRLRTADGAGAFCDLAADPELFQGPRGDCQVSTSGLYYPLILNLLGSGESNKGQELGSLYLQLVCRTHLASSGRKSV